MNETRPTLLIAIWFLSTIVLATLFISAGIMGDFTTAHIFFATVILALAVAGTGIILRWKDNDQRAPQEKAKGVRTYDLFNNMSDDEILELKRRLSDVDLSQATLANTLGDDGEIVQQRSST